MKVIVEREWLERRFNEEDDKGNDQQQQNDDQKDGENKDGDKKEGEDDGLSASLLKKAWGAVKKKAVSLLTGNVTASAIDTILSILGFLPGIDREEMNKKLGGVADKMKGGLDSTQEFINRIPLVGDFLSDDVEALNNICRFAVFTFNCSAGIYPPENYDLASVAAGQASCYTAIALYSALAAATAATAGLGSVVTYILKDLVSSVFNAVFKMVNDDMLKFEEWAKKQNIDLEAQKKSIAKGDGKANVEKVKQANAKDNKNGNKDGDNKNDGNNGQGGGQNNGNSNDQGNNNGDQKQQANEGLGKLISGAVKAGVKALKPAAKKAAKGALQAAKDGAKEVVKDVAKDATKAAIQQVKKGIGKLTDAACQKIAKLSPSAAEFLREGINEVLEACSKSGMNEESVNKYIQDFIEDSMGSASNGEDKKTLDAMKIEIGNTKKQDEMIAKIKNMVQIAGTANGSENGKENSDQNQTSESRKRKMNGWIALK